MSYRYTSIIGALFLTVALAAPASAIDKEHRQMMADIRILQEQSQQMQNVLVSMNQAMTEALKALNARIDEQTNTMRKSLADQKLVLDGLSNDTRVIRERLDDNNVRIGSLTQEVEALRQSVQQLSTRPSLTETAPALGAPPEAAASQTAGSAPSSVPIGTSPQRLFDEAQSDFFLGGWDLAISGFDSFLRSFPRHDLADDAQLYIGRAFLQSGRFEKAVEAFDLTIRNYPSSNVIPEAYYRKGLALQNLKADDRAKEAWEFVVKNYPNSSEAGLASQGLARLARPTSAPAAPN